MRGLLPVLLLLAGCDLQRFAIDHTAPVLLRAMGPLQREGDVQLAREALPAELKLVEGLLETAPGNRTLLHIVAQGYVEYAFGFLEDDSESLPDDPAHADERAAVTARATALYDRALALSLRSITTCDPRFGAAFQGRAEAMAGALRRIGRECVPGLFYGGFALAAAVNLNRTDLRRVVALPRAVLLLRRAGELDPHFAQGGPAMVLGVIHAAQGESAGGDPRAAWTEFMQAQAVSGGRYLMARVMLARHYGVATQDRGLFQRTLEEVLRAPEGTLPEQRLANALARRRARRYLAQIDDYF